jgi:hypothetical protein
MPNLNQIWQGVYCCVPFPLCVYFADILLRTHNKSMPTYVKHWVFTSSRARLSIIDVLNTGKLTLRLCKCLPRYDASSCLFTTREILWHSAILLSWPDFICSKGIVCCMLFAVISVSCNLGVFLYLREFKILIQRQWWMLDTLQVNGKRAVDAKWRHVCESAVHSGR